MTPTRPSSPSIEPDALPDHDADAATPLDEGIDHAGRPLERVTVTRSRARRRRPARTPVARRHAARAAERRSAARDHSRDEPPR